jgi:hypothetical protein
MFTASQISMKLFTHSLDDQLAHTTASLTPSELVSLIDFTSPSVHIPMTDARRIRSLSSSKHKSTSRGGMICDSASAKLLSSRFRADPVLWPALQGDITEVEKSRSAAGVLLKQVRSN